MKLKHLANSDIFLPVMFLVTVQIFGCSVAPEPLAMKDGVPGNVAKLLNSNQLDWWGYSEIRGGGGIITLGMDGASIMSGEHVYQFLVTRRSKLTFITGWFMQDVVYPEAVCALQLNAHAGYVYELGEVSKPEDSSVGHGMVYRAESQVVERNASGVERNYVADVECARVESLRGAWVSQQGSLSPPTPWRVYKVDLLCQIDEQCTEAGQICKREEGFSFGSCITP